MSDKKLIFVVDDDADARNLIKYSLSPHYHVMTFETPTPALKMSTETRPYLILADINMPNIDGIEMLRVLKEHPFTYDIPVICISADDSSTVRERIKDAGGMGLIKKPFDTKSLHSAIEGLLNSAFLHLKDRSGHLSYYIYYNRLEQERLLDQLCEKGIQRGKKVYFLSWRKGEAYKENQLLQDFIKQEQLVFLEVKNTLLTRFPYLQDLSPIYHDLKAFYVYPPRESILIIDDLRQLLGADLHLMEQKVITLIELLKRDFAEINILSIKSRNKEINNSLQKIAREFVNS